MQSSISIISQLADDLPGNSCCSCVVGNIVTLSTRAQADSVKECETATRKILNDCFDKAGADKAKSAEWVKKNADAKEKCAAAYAEPAQSPEPAKKKTLKDLFKKKQ